MLGIVEDIVSICILLFVSRKRRALEGIDPEEEAREGPGGYEDTNHSFVKTLVSVYCSNL